MNKYKICVSFILIFVLVIIPINYTYCADEYDFLSIVPNGVKKVTDDERKKALQYIDDYDKKYEEIKNKKSALSDEEKKIKKRFENALQYNLKYVTREDDEYYFLVIALEKNYIVTKEDREAAIKYIIENEQKYKKIDNKKSALSEEEKNIKKRYENAIKYNLKYLEQEEAKEKAQKDALDAAKTIMDTGAETIKETNPDDTQWVQDSFKAVGNFFEEDVTEHDPLKLHNWLLPFFENIIKWINRILLVALFGLSAIALSYCGLQYILTADGPNQKVNARENIRTTFIGMFYGFGAYAIWGIAMQVVKVILGSFSS